jgi:hypothetical protein
MPVIEGVPMIVITSADQETVTPGGKPIAVPIPVAPVVAIVIFVKVVFTKSHGLDEGVPAVFGVHDETVIVPVAFTLPQPPVKEIV